MIPRFITSVISLFKTERLYIVVLQVQCIELVPMGKKDIYLIFENKKPYTSSTLVCRVQ